MSPVALRIFARAHGRGGSLLVVPADTQVWRDSMLQPVTYSVAPPFCALVDPVREDRDERSWPPLAGSAMHRVVEGIAGLTAVDGATVITDLYELLAFGAKILRRAHWEPVSNVMLTDDDRRMDRRRQQQTWATRWHATPFSRSVRP